MRTFYLSAIFISVFSVMGFAQQKTDVEFGAQVGYNRSGIDLGAGATGNATVSGFNAGIYADMYWSDRWSFKARVLYDQKGFAQKDFFVYAAGYYGASPASSPAQVTYNNININYLTVPLMANWHFGRTHRWYLNFGAYLGFLLSAKETGSFPDYQDITSQYNTIDAGLALGIGIKIPVSKHLKLFMEYDMQNGLTNALDGSANGGLSYQNVRGSLNIGVYF